MELGWRLEPSKEVGPRDRLDALGVDVDFQGELLRLTTAKRERYAAHADERWLRASCAIASASLGC